MTSSESSEEFSKRLHKTYGVAAGERVLVYYDKTVDLEYQKLVREGR